MKLSQLLEHIPLVSVNADMDADITGVSYDSRGVLPGQLFVAISGYASDGHTYIPAALQKGAAVVLCERVPERACAYVQVASSREALAQLGANWYGHPADAMQMIGVTGTNGKTTVTYLLKTLLEQTLHAKVGLIGTIQNMIGDRVLETERTTPESFELQGLLAEMRQAGCTHVVMEVSSHALALHRVDCISYEIGIFTNLTEDHLDFHKTMDAYREVKAILFRRCKKGVFNLDDAAAQPMMAQASCDCFTVSVKTPQADLFAAQVVLGSDHVSFDAVCRGEKTPVHLGIPGSFTAYNALSVLGAAALLGIAPDEAARALRGAKSVRGRMEVVPTPGADYTVLIDYAHTPDALENTLRSVRGFCKGRLIAVFGCGGDRDAMKRPIMGEIGVRLADLPVITSDNPRTEDPNKIIEDILRGVPGDVPYTVVENRREAIAWAMHHAKKDDIIVLAGKGHETYQIIGTEKTHLDEREVVAAVLAEA